MIFLTLSLTYALYVFLACLLTLCYFLNFQFLNIKQDKDIMDGMLHEGRVGKNTGNGHTEPV